MLQEPRGRGLEEGRKGQVNSFIRECSSLERDSFNWGSSDRHKWGRWHKRLRRMQGALRSSEQFGLNRGPCKKQR